MRFRDIKQLTTKPAYHTNYPWRDLPEKIERWENELGLQLNPDFQRGHVWDVDKQRAYIEFVLRGGQGARDLYFNHPNWQGSYVGDFVLVDGLQRLTAILSFMRGELKIFAGYDFFDFEDTIPHNIDVVLHVNDLKKRSDVLNWYLEMNSGGVVHSQDELDRVRKLLDEELGNG